MDEWPNQWERTLEMVDSISVRLSTILSGLAHAFPWVSPFCMAEKIIRKMKQETFLLPQEKRGSTQLRDGVFDVIQFDGKNIKYILMFKRQFKKIDSLNCYNRIDCRSVPYFILFHWILDNQTNLNTYFNLINPTKHNWT